MTAYAYTSGGFPASPAADDTLAMKGTTYKYNGSAWEVQTGGTTSFTYTATSGQTAFTGADTGSKTLAYTAASIHVFLNGVLLDAADYTATDGTTVTLAVGATTGDTLQVVAYGVLVSAGGGGGGAWEVISSQAVSSAVSSVDFDISTYSSYEAFMLIGTNICADVSDYVTSKYLYMGYKTSEAGGDWSDAAVSGNTMWATRSDSSYSNLNVDSWNATDKIYLDRGGIKKSPLASNTTVKFTGHRVGEAGMFEARTSSRYEAYDNGNDAGWAMTTAGEMYDTGASGGSYYRQSDESITDIRIALTSGNLSSGTFTLYGIKTS